MGKYQSYMIILHEDITKLCAVICIEIPKWYFLLNNTVLYPEVSHISLIENKNIL